MKTQNPAQKIPVFFSCNSEGKHSKQLNYGTTNSRDKLEFKSQLRLELLGGKTRDFLGLNLNIVCWDGQHIVKYGKKTSLINFYFTKNKFFFKATHYLLTKKCIFLLIKNGNSKKLL